MDTLRITVVGQDNFGLVKRKMELVGINDAKEVRSGMLGNLKTLTYEIALKENEVMKVRTMLLDKILEDDMRLMPMFVHKDWMRVFVFKPLIM